MLQTIRRKWLAIAISLVAIASMLLVTVYYRRGTRPLPEERSLAPKEEAPADLAKLSETYKSGVQALERGDATEAVRKLGSFSFGRRAVEEYRLYYLANAHQLAGAQNAARATLAALWRKSPRLVHANDAAFTLAHLYAGSADWKNSAGTYAEIARRSEIPAVAATARWSVVHARMHSGDLAGALFSARNIAIKSPRAPEAAEAIALAKAILGLGEDDNLPLTPAERLERANALLDAGDAQNALEELTALESDAPHMRGTTAVQRGIALNKLRRYEDSNKVLEPLTSGPYKQSIPALRYAARNYAILASAIDPNVTKTIKEKKRKGSVKVRVGKGKKRRTVTKPRYITVTRQVKLVDLAKKQKKEEYERLASERLKDLLSLPLDEQLRFEVLSALASRAEAKNQDDYLQELVPQIIRIDPAADPALQRFWDKAWAAYTRGDLGTARKLFRFIGDTYTHPNVRRQTEYWYARTIERVGEKEEAAAIYRKLAAAPYADLYARHAIARGAPHESDKSNPLEKKGDDWREIAEREMPGELRLAYELTALSAMRDAFNEIRNNMKRENVRYAESLMADVYASQGNELLMYRSLRRAWPQLATVEQDSVPRYFLSMYYPLKYSESIEKYAKQRGLDPNLVRGLILQESYYNPEAQSRVGATGLMQLMPATAKDHARKLRIAFVTSRLENPDVNIQLGTFHLKMLVNMFQGNTYLAVASYNAGQGNVAKWRRGAAGKPLDEFLESIPFPETRNYVKRVTMLSAAYERLGS